MIFHKLLLIIFSYIVIHNDFFIYCDVAENWQLGLQDPATVNAEGMLFFHHYLMFFLILIAYFVCWMLYKVIVYFDESTHKSAWKFSHSELLETVWSAVPCIILLAIAGPSFALLYSLDDYVDTFSFFPITLKVVGHQWYWSYEYTDYSLDESLTSGINFDSYMISTSDLTYGSFRLLEVDHRVILPIKSDIHIIVTSADVLHSWAVPSFGIKIDACPGRITEGLMYIKREGVYYGQCSEICGVNHGFMPIVVKAVSPYDFRLWTMHQLDENFPSSEIDEDATTIPLDEEPSLIEDNNTFLENSHDDSSLADTTKEESTIDSSIEEPLLTNDGDILSGDILETDNIENNLNDIKKEESTVDSGNKEVEA